MAIFSKFFFRTFFYHPEIPSSLYGATVDVWRPHGARFILLVPIWGGGVGGGAGGWNYRFGDLPPTPP